MSSTESKFHIYAGQHVDLIMGTAIAVAYVTVGDGMGIFPAYIESSTINYADLVAVNLGLATIPDAGSYTVHTNSRYVEMVMVHCQSWRDQGILDGKAHPEQVKILLGHISRLGNGRVETTMRSHQRPELMLRLLKHAKHFYHEAQTQMIAKRTTALDSSMFGEPVFIQLKDVPGSVLWKKPFSLSVFQTKMEKSRNGNKVGLRLIEGGSK